MTLSIRRSKQNPDFGFSSQKSFKSIESPSLGLAKKQNKLEEEIYKHKILKLEAETSSSLIKLCKRIYETSLELNRVNFELKRNKLETVYKNYNFCQSYRSKKNVEFVTGSELNSNNNTTNKDIIGEVIDSKDDKLNKFLVDLSTKSEHEIDFLLSNRPKTTPFTKKKYENKNDKNIFITRMNKSEAGRTILIKKQNDKNKEEYLKTKPKKMLIKESKPQGRSSENKTFTQNTMQSLVNDADKKCEFLIHDIPPRPQTSINYHREPDKGYTFKTRRRASSITKIAYEKPIETIKEEDEEEYIKNMSDLCRETFSSISNTSSNNKSNSSKSSSKSKKMVSGKLNSKPSDKDKTHFKIDNLYEKSIENLDRVSSKFGFKNNSLDDEDWLNDLKRIQAKRRALVSTNRKRYRVCSAWVNQIDKKQNFNVTSRIKLNRLSSKSSTNTRRFDMAKEKEIFELTHKNLKDLMIKQMTVTIAKEHDKNVKEYVKNNLT